MYYLNTYCKVHFVRIPVGKKIRKIELHDRAASAALISFSLRTWISSAASSRSSRV